MPIRPLMTPVLVLALTAFPAGAQDAPAAPKSCPQPCSPVSPGAAALPAVETTLAAPVASQASSGPARSPIAIAVQEQASGEAPRGFLGIQVATGDGAVVVQGVFPGTPAARAGLEVGDRIVRIQGGEVGEGEEALAGLHGTRPGEKVAVRVERNGWTRDMEITLGTFDSSWQSGRAPGGDASEGGSVELEFRPGEAVEPEAARDAEAGSPRLFRWRSSDVDESDEEQEVEDEDGDEDEDEDEDEDGAHTRTYSRTFTVPGGEGRIEIRVEADGESSLHQLDLGDLHLPFVIESDGRVEVGQGEGRPRIRVHVGDDEDGSHDLRVIHPRRGDQDVLFFDREGAEKLLDEEHLGKVIEKIKKEVGGRAGEELRADARRPELRAQAQGPADLDGMRKEIAELREEIAGLRRLREEMREVRELRTEIRALIERLGREQ